MPNINLKRKRLSGSQYKKKSEAKKEREEQLNKKTKKLDNYFKLKVSVHFITIAYSLQLYFYKITDYLIIKI